MTLPSSAPALKADLAPNRWLEQDWLGRTSAVLSYAILLGGIATIAVCAYMVVVTYSSLPYWDGWAQIGVLVNGKSPFSPAWLWRQHNEHRLVIPKLFLAVDSTLFHARQVFLLAGIFVTQLLHLLLWGFAMRVLGGWRGPLWRAGFGLAAFCLFCPSQAENLIWGFQICYVLPAFFATLSFTALLLYCTRSERSDGGRSPWGFLLLSIAAALASTYSLASGSILWPLLVLAALVLRLRRSAVLSLALAGLVSIALYSYHFVRPQYHSNPIASLRTPLKLLQYVGTVLGSSWSPSHAWPAEVIVFAGLIIALIPVCRTRSYAQISRPFAVQLVLTILFCLATTCLTASARLVFGLTQATTSRYQTIALLFWFCLGLLLLALAFALRPKQYPFLIIEVCLLVIMARGAGLAQRPIEGARLFSFRLHVATAAFLTNVLDPAAMAHIYFYSPDSLVLVAAYMREHRLSVFSGPSLSRLGKPLEWVFPVVTSEHCTGSLESALPIDTSGEPGLRIKGWVWDRKHRRPPSEVVAIRDGVITGLAAIGELRPEIAATNPEVSNSYLGFAGYVREPHASAPVEVYAILGDNPPSACYFATVRAVQ